MSRARDIANLLSTDSPLIDNAPDALNTLNELAAALGDDENFATTVTNSLAGKADTDKFNVPAENELALRPDGSTEAVRIDSSGNVGIGTTDPNGRKLRIDDPNFDDHLIITRSGAPDLHFSTSSAPNGGVIFAGNTSSNGIYVYENGQFSVPAGPALIGTTTPGSAGAGDLVVNGGVFLGGSAAANELDDYEEGTWTPTLTTDGTDFTSITYDGVTSGFYTKIGQRVFFSCFVMTDSVTVGSASGNVIVDGLPFTVANLTGIGNEGAVTVGYTLQFDTNNPSAGLCLENSSQIALYYRSAPAGGTTNLPFSSIATTTNKNQIYLSGHYVAA